MTAEELCGRIWKRLIEDGSGGGYAVTLKYTELLGVIRETMETCAQAAEAHAARVRSATADVGWKMSEELEERAVECEKAAAAIRARAAP